jgi:pyruvate/2-oxoglutarate dehydrogenase complex dihydrolipoamide acyltransferase (E2) component
MSTSEMPHATQIEECNVKRMADHRQSITAHRGFFLIFIVVFSSAIFTFLKYGYRRLRPSNGG